MPALTLSQERVLAVMSGEGKIYSDFYKELKNNLDSRVELEQINLSEFNETTARDYELVISVGSKAAYNLVKYKVKEKVIYTLIPDNELLRKRIHCEDMSCYKIYLNQPISRYLQLFKILFNKNKNLVLATINENSSLSNNVKKESKKIGVVYKELQIANKNNISRTLINQLKSNYVLLALPNPQIYNKNNAKHILLSAYHANVPIIAYSKSFAKAGALVSLYSSIANVAKKTASVVNTIVQSGVPREKEYYPDDFTIEINYTVANSLNIDIEPKSVIERKIK